MFVFRKLYTDIITPSGDVGISYVTEMNLLGSTSYGSGFEMYRSDGTQRVFHSHSQTLPQWDSTSPLNLSIPFQFSEGNITLTYRGAHPVWSPATPLPIRGMEWESRLPRADVQISLNLDGNEWEWNGQGYSDWVVLRRFPRFLRMKKLQWGRLHLPDSTVIYNRLETRSGEVWACVADWHESQFQEIAVCSPVWKQDTLLLAVGERSYHLTPQRILHEGAALNEERFPSRLERWLVRHLSGSMTETRWVSKVVLEERGEVKEGWALHEEVHFG